MTTRSAATAEKQRVSDHVVCRRTMIAVTTMG